MYVLLCNGELICALERHAYLLRLIEGLDHLQLFFMVLLLHLIHVPSHYLSSLTFLAMGTMNPCMGLSVSQRGQIYERTCKTQHCDPDQSHETALLPHPTD